MATAAPSLLGDVCKQGVKPSPAHAFLKPGKTFPRVDVEEKEEASSVYAEGTATDFHLRIGPNYSKHKQKGPSLSEIYSLVALDVFRSDERVFPAAQVYDLPPLSPHARDFDHDYVCKRFILNIQVPDCPAPFRSSAAVENPTMHIVMFFEISEEAVSYFKDLAHAPPAYKLLSDWCRDSFTDDKCRSRFKIIGIAENFADLGLPTLIQGYNGKPALIKSTGSLVRGENNEYMEQGINVHLFPFLTRKSVYGLQGKMRLMITHIGATIEARSDEEMPERTLLCARLVRINGFEEARKLPIAALRWLRTQAAAMNHNPYVQSVIT
eukprot:m.24063 g.24063  ORF g.24063 m.24063 type:complete len:324 (+) comp8558_c0_seq1:95-1066(+)